MKLITDVFRKPSADALAQRELEENRRCLLDAQRSRDYHTKLVEFYQVRIAALQRQLREANEDA